MMRIYLDQMVEERHEERNYPHPVMMVMILYSALTEDAMHLAFEWKTKIDSLIAVIYSNHSTFAME